MVFIAHFKCGFGVFPSKFLEWIYRHYGIQLAHLLPNAIATLSVLAFLCEVWLDIKPYLDLWHHFYSAAYYSKKFVIGLVGFSF